MVDNLSLFLLETIKTKTMKRPHSKAHGGDDVTDTDKESTDIEPECVALHRSCCFTWTFPTPKDYRKEQVGRRKNLEYVPDDFSGEDIALLFLNALKHVYENENLEEMIVVQEPHKGRDAFHYHVVFKMRTPSLCTPEDCQVLES